MCSTFVPLGIKSFDNKFENKYISLSYTLSDNAQEVTLQIRDGEEEIYKKVITSPSEVSKGQHFWSWDGFDKNGILDTARLTKAKRLNYKISVKRKNNIFSETQYFKISYSEVNWVDVKINRPKKEIYVTLRVNLRDGGAEGLKGFRIQQTSSFGTYTNIEIDPPRDVPAAILKKWGHPPITSRTRSYENLRDLALKGIEKYWSRHSLNIGKNIKVNNETYQVFVEAIYDEKGMIAPKIIFFTNKKNNNLNRSRNWSLSRELYYKVGYIQREDNNWKYINESEAIVEFQETAAHEIGHKLLEEYGDMWYSYKHKGTSTLVTQVPLENTPFPIIGEIDLMKYSSDMYYPSDYYDRVILSEKDLKGLLWFTKMKIEK
jgi:PAAR domain-containing protein